MADPREVTASEVLTRILARLERQGIDRKLVQLVVQAFDQAGFEMREKGGRDPVPIGEQVTLTRRQIGDSDDWLLEADIGGGSRVVCVESLVQGHASRSAWTAVPAAPA
jgi:hypothetical protein